MINGFYAAKSGMRTAQFSLDVTGNNIANANTDGYQARNANFADLIYTRTQGLEVVAGNGVRAVSTSVSNAQNPFLGEGRYSAAIVGEGYYAVQNPAEDAEQEVLYMRASAFALTSDGNATYLVAQGGAYVLDEAGQRIEVQNGDVDAALRRIALLRIPNPGAMTALGGGQFMLTEQAGEAAADETSTMNIGVMAGSNVDMSMEMAHMIVAQRGFQMNARMLQTIDEIEQTASMLNG